MIEVVGHVDPKEVFPLEKVSNLAYFSFKFSQGNNYLQKEIFEYLHILHPQLRIDDAKKQLISERTKKMVDKYLTHAPETAHGMNPKPKIFHVSLSQGKPFASEKEMEKIKEEELQKRMDQMQEAFNSTTTVQISSITIRIIDNDFLNLYERGGLKDRSHPKTDNSANDPWASHICHYALNGNPTGIEEFNRMFQDVNNFLRTQGTSNLSRETDSKLDNVIRIYNEKHPKSPARL